MNALTKILLSLLVLLLPACVVHERAVVHGPGVYATLPAGYAGSYYLYGGRYYYGGRHEAGRYYWHGRYHSSRYYHNGHYYYGGAFYPGR